MNVGLSDVHPSIEYYDSDYPGQATARYPENFDETTVYQGLSHDIDRYLSLARRCDGPVVELCCGTGRVSIPITRGGHQIIAVDMSIAMLDQFRVKLDREAVEVRQRISLEQQDVRHLELDGRYSLITVPFNSLVLPPKGDPLPKPVFFEKERA